MKKKSLLLLSVFLINTYTFATFSWGTVTQEADNFKTNAIIVAKAVAIGILALSFAFLLYKILGKSQDKKDAIIYFVIALILNGLFWGWI